MPDSDIQRLVERIASDVEQRIASEFKGFWAPEDLIEEIPGMIRESGRAALRARITERTDDE